MFTETHSYDTFSKTRKGKNRKRQHETGIRHEREGHDF
jgi:hypothetical protein